MKRNLRFPLMLIVSIFFTVIAQSQPDRFAYAITDSVRDGAKWNFLRKIDLRTGNFSGTLLRLLNKNDTISNAGLCNGVAAIAVDDKNKRLYYTPMLTDRLAYVDLRTMRIHIVSNNFTGLFPKLPNQTNIIIRMVIGDDDYGYALTNDGNHLIRFGIKNNQVRDLGPLTDARGNNGVSVHEVCSSYGGDIIYGDEDFLYLITSRNYVFKINIKSRITKYQGTISGLPSNFTTSGVAVDYRRNRIVVASSINASDIYAVDFSSLHAAGLKADNVWLSSDLAGSNILKSKNDDDDDRELFVDADSYKVKLFPNPVTNNQFKVQFIDNAPGNYTVSLIDILGQRIATNFVNTGDKNKTFVVNVPSSTSKGIFSCENY